MAASVADAMIKWSRKEYTISGLSETETALDLKKAILNDKNCWAFNLRAPKIVFIMKVLHYHTCYNKQCLSTCGHINLQFKNRKIGTFNKLTRSGVKAKFLYFSFLHLII